MTGSVSRSIWRVRSPLIGLPGGAAIVAAEELVGGEIDPRGRVRAQQQRRIPVPTQGRLAFARQRLNAHGLVGAAVEADQPAVLAFGVDDVGILGIDAGMEAVAALRDEPVGVGDAVGAARSRRSAEREIVLGAAIDVIERSGAVHGDVVELGDGQVRLEAPVDAAVVAFVDAAIAADQIVARVLRDRSRFRGCRCACSFHRARKAFCRHRRTP